MCTKRKTSVFMWSSHLLFGNEPFASLRPAPGQLCGPTRLLHFFLHLSLCSLRLSVYFLCHFAPSGFVLCTHILNRFAPADFVLCTRIFSRFALSGFVLRTHITVALIPHALHSYSVNYNASQSIRSLESNFFKNAYTVIDCAMPSTILSNTSQ